MTFGAIGFRCRAQAHRQTTYESRWNDHSHGVTYWKQEERSPDCLPDATWGTLVEASSSHANTFSEQHSARTVARSPTIPFDVDCFKYIFSSSVAQTKEDRRACFRMRFQAYCVDKHFVDPADNPGGFEIDAFDHQSVHSLLTHRQSGNAIGTVRLVLPYSGCERRPLPIELLLAGQPMPFPIDRTAEISRFALAKSFQQYVPSRGLEAELSREEWRKLLDQLPLGLLKSCLEMSAHECMTHLVAVMEPSLLRHLRRFGIHLNLLGGEVEYHGRRQPCWVEIDALLRSLQQQRPEIWKLLTDNGRLWTTTSRATSH